MKRFKYKVKWRCPGCGRKNRWKWMLEEGSGPVSSLTCEHCQRHWHARLTCEKYKVYL